MQDLRIGATETAISPAIAAVTAAVTSISRRPWVIDVMDLQGVPESVRVFGAREVLM